jgi:MFS family permease
MTDTPQQDALDRRRVTVLAGSVAMLLVSGGGMYLIVVALKDVAMEFGWPRAVPSLAFSLQFIGSGFGGIVMGYALDRYGFIVPALVGTVMVGLGGILGARIESAWQLYLIYGFMFGLSGQGSLSAPALANIARWYDRGRGMAVGIASSGQALAGIVWPPIFGFVLAAVGWRDMFFWFGVFAFCVMLPLCLVVRHRPPSYVAPVPESPPDGERQERSREPAAAARPVSTRAMQVTLCFAIFGCCVAMSLPLGHLVSLVTDRGHPIHNAVEVLSVMLMAAFVSRAVLLGLLSDRLGGLRALIVFSVVQAATLASFTVVHELWAFYVVAVLCGLGYGGLFPIYAVVTREHLPIAEVGRRTGVVFLSGAIAMGFGSWMGGYLFDLTGSYTLPFLIGVAFNIGNLVIVTALILRIRPPMPMRLRRA